MIMASHCLVLADHHKNIIFFFFIFHHFFSVHGLTGGTSLSVKNTNHILISPNGLFTAGFHQVGDNAYCFAVWFMNQAMGEGRTVVWMANHADQYIIWSTHTKSTSSSVQLQLNSTGNLILYEGEQVLWQSFDYPTDTLLPNQPLTKNTQLVSSRSSTNYSSGFYKLSFDLNSILCLRYEGPETTSVYWPFPGSPTWVDGRYQLINSQEASLDSAGIFTASDGFSSLSADFGIGPQRMMRMDTDGNIRVYSLIEDQRIKKWQVQWQAISHSCRIHGICRPNSLCSYSKNSGRRCTCLHGYKMVNSEDWSYGCAPKFEGCRPDEEGFIELPQVQFYGYDGRSHPNYTLDSCKKDCLNNCTCKEFDLQMCRRDGEKYDKILPEKT
ncbi:hypothetical protein L2E82_46996 [Cichorium intybus]|uniref:Uncharacterized protein n=1 Tax=Cichorium intybus TaxID=13427 RepID=A0ACB8YUS1_CICIN|nr:hypothetical protein L2E82_46996 [Cichorium intybus]